jgi:hypothetical protein
MMKKILALGMCALAACAARPAQPSPSIVTAAINEALANPRQVATFDATDTCIEVRGNAKQLGALQKYGLVNVGRENAAGGKVPFTFTALGDTYRVGANLCFARIAVSAIKNVMVMGNMAHIDYRFKFLNVAAWARKPEIQAAFPEIKTMLKGQDPFDARKATLFLTNGEWAARAV